MLEVNNFSVNAEDGSPILKGLNISVKPGEIHAIMGPNGAGKSTLTKALGGHPSYTVTAGSVQFKGIDLLDLEPEERVHQGFFMSFQYPLEIPGVSNQQFLLAALNEKRKAFNEAPYSEEVFEKLLDKKMEEMQIPVTYKNRGVNEGFSGGEKKRSEILQMTLIDPDFAILDETDSGLDIDAMKIVSAGVNAFMNKSKSLILITHYQRLLDYIKPDFVHVLVDGKIVHSGTAELAEKLEEQGYDWLLSC